jgi:CBS domain containing-hemolysin-like protein
VIGILHTKDVVTGFVQNANLTIASLLRPIVRVPETMPADQLLSFLRERRSHQALVVDAQGVVVGLITLEDVVAELLGGVADEFKTAHVRAIRLSDGRLRIPGMMRLDQVSSLVGGSWPAGTETVGNHVVQVLGRVPEPGEEAVVDDVAVEVEAVEGTAVTSLIAGRRPQSEDGAP